jgi:large subunit ribosomal protein L4
VRAALAQKLSDGAVIVVERLETADGKTKGTAEMFRRLGVSGKAVVIDVKPDEKFVMAARNIDGIELVSAARVTARDIMDTAHVVATREAIEKLQESLG